MKKDPTLTDIEDMLIKLFNHKKQEREVVVYRGCIHRKEPVPVFYYCGDPECPGCQLYYKSLQDTLDKRGDEDSSFINQLKRVKKEIDKNETDSI